MSPFSPPTRDNGITLPTRSWAPRPLLQVEHSRTTFFWVLYARWCCLCYTQLHKLCPKQFKISPQAQHETLPGKRFTPIYCNGNCSAPPKNVPYSQYNLNISDRFSKLTQADPTLKMTATHIAHLSIDHCINTYINATYLQTGNGTLNTSTYFKTGCSILKAINVVPWPGIVC